MLKQLKLSNFRIFDDEVTVRFRPITILIGKNNAGKSSIIKFLLMLQQSLDLGMSEFLVPNGSKTNLGNFSLLKNSLTDNNELWFELKMVESRSMSEILDSFLSEKVDRKKLYFTTNGIVSYEGNLKVKQHEVILSEDNREILAQEKYFLDQARFLDFSDEFAKRDHFEASDVDRKEHLVEKKIIETIAYNTRNIFHMPAYRDELPSSFSKDDLDRNTLLDLHKIQQDDRIYEFILPYIKKTAGIEKIEFKNLAGPLEECIATNFHTKAKSLISSFGFGVSQCVPIFVQGAIMSRHTSLMIEQPEAQLHPTAQLEIGSFFADLWNERGVGSIIETHSNNIILRLRRLVAEGKMKADDISIAFLDVEDGKAVIKNLDIGQDGTMEDGLPMEFFGGDIIEGLKLSAAKFKPSGEDHEQLDQ